MGNFSLGLEPKLPQSSLFCTIHFSETEAKTSVDHCRNSTSARRRLSTGVVFVSFKTVRLSYLPSETFEMKKLSLSFF